MNNLDLVSVQQDLQEILSTNMEYNVPESVPITLDLIDQYLNNKDLCSCCEAQFWLFDYCTVSYGKVYSKVLGTYLDVRGGGRKIVLLGKYRSRRLARVAAKKFDKKNLHSLDIVLNP